MPLLRASASDVTATVKASAQVNAAIGGASSKGGNSAPPPAGGASAGRAVVTQSAVAKSGSGTFSVLRSVVRGPISRRITWAANRINEYLFTVAMASNDNATLVYSIEPFAGLCVSKNANVGPSATWIKKTTTGGHAGHVRCSRNGLVVITAVGTADIFTSRDGLETHVKTTMAGKTFTYSAVTPDGSMFMAGTSTEFYTSPDGITWTLRSNLATTNPALVATNSVLYLVTSNVFRMSTDMGLTWSSRTMTGVGAFRGIDCSLDGQTIVLGTAGNTPSVLVTNNGGTTWTSFNIGAAGGSWTVSCSRDGSVISVGMFNGPVFISTDSGVSFAQQTVPNADTRNYANVVCVSGNGSIVIATQYAYPHRAIIS